MWNAQSLWLVAGLAFLCLAQAVRADDDLETETVVEDLGAARDGSQTDSEVADREAESIQLDGLSVKEMRELKDKSEKHHFQAEVNRMMKLIINSLYRNKEIFLRELISNASDALDKIRLLSLSDRSVLDSTDELSIRIKADKEGHVLTITDTGVGMTKADLINHLGTIAKSGTADFFSQMNDASSDTEQMSDLIGQFGVGFYSAFLVADKVIVTTKHNSDQQYIWESDSNSYSVVEDPRGNTLKRGTQISLFLKEEAYDYLEQDSVRDLIKKYSQFINFNIYMWGSSTQTVEEPLDEDEPVTEKPEASEDEDAAVEDEEPTEDQPKTKKVEKTTWDWDLINNAKPIWTRKPNDIDGGEYSEFYKSITKDTNGPLAYTHFVAEGEVTFKSLLFVPVNQPSETFNKYGTTVDNIKLYLLRFFSSDGKLASLAEYVERMKDKQEQIFYMAGSSKAEVEASPFVERLLKKGYEVLYLTEAVDEYSISALPEFEGKKFQNVAKEGFSLDGETESAKQRKNELKERYEPLTKWLQEDALKDHVLRAEISERLDKSPCALITSRFGWTANMQRIIGSQTHSKTNDMQRDYYLNQKKALEINPRHPLVKELLRRVEDNPDDTIAKDMSLMMFNTATLRSGYMLKDTSVFATHIENMMRETLGIDKDEQVEEEEELPEEEPAEDEDDDDEEEEEDDEEEEEEEENAEIDTEPRDEL
eukprot:maker-scaffold222_size251774-snap-gene-0.22 protein:Tk11432 transcript:maker-scaffold222_size251774-snap-gene-0.22-mRNA-1 annotation:"PREDICTED: endoplasmin-like"